MINKTFFLLIFLITIIGFSLGLKLSTAFYHLTYQSENILFKSGYWQIFDTEVFLQKNQVLYSQKELVKENKENAKLATSSYQRYDLENADYAFYLSFNYKFADISNDVENKIKNKIENTPNLFVKLNGKVIRQVAQVESNTKDFDQIFIPIFPNEINKELVSQNLEFVATQNFEINDLTTKNWLVDSGDILVFKTKNHNIELLDNEEKSIITLDKKYTEKELNIFEYQIQQESLSQNIKNYRALNASKKVGKFNDINLVFTPKIEVTNNLSYETYLRDKEFNISFLNLPDDVIKVTAERVSSDKGQKTSEVVLEPIKHLEESSEIPTKFSKNKKQFFSFNFGENIEAVKIKITLETETQKNSIYFIDI